jgi:hypothetical protein
MAIRRLEPSLGGIVEDLKASQIAGQRDLVVLIERSFRQIQENLESLIRERESFLAVLCRAHSDSLVLIEKVKGNEVSQEAANQADTLASWLGRNLENAGVEIITNTKGLPYDAACMQIQRTENREDIDVGLVLKELAPGYRIQRGDTYKYLVRAMVVVNVAKI